MATLQEYEARIESIARGELVCYTEPDLYGRMNVRPTTPADLCDALYSLEGGLRRTLWSGPYQGWARELIERADREVRRLCEVHGLLYSGRAPLYSGGWTGSGYANAID